MTSPADGLRFSFDRDAPRRRLSGQNNAPIVDWATEQNQRLPCEYRRYGTKPETVDSVRPQIPIYQIEEKCCDKRSVHNESRVTFNRCRPDGVIVDSMAVKG
jgi:hypothetical protein